MGNHSFPVCTNTHLYTLFFCEIERTYHFSARERTLQFHFVNNSFVLWTRTPNSITVQIYSALKTEGCYARNHYFAHIVTSFFLLCLYTCSKFRVKFCISFSNVFIVCISAIAATVYQQILHFELAHKHRELISKN